MKSTVKLMVLAAALFLSSCGKSIPDRLRESTVLVKTEDGHGTAFFVRGKRGVCTLLTAAHVVLGKEVVRLQTRDGRERKPLQILPFDRDLDLAAVTFAPRKGGGCPYRPLELGNSEKVEGGRHLRNPVFLEKPGFSIYILCFSQSKQKP
jgi:hypothetical protein